MVNRIIKIIKKKIVVIYNQNAVDLRCIYAY